MNARVVPAVVAAIGLLWSASTLQAAEAWRPLDPKDIAATASTVEKDADAEALFWEVWLDDAQSDRTVFRHYLRIKVFNARGVESQSRMDLPYADGIRIADIAARTVKPDGSVVELKKDAVFERTIVKLGKMKVRSKSFVMPGVEPGAILEYQWREEHQTLAQYSRLKFQREIPARSVKYYIKPFVSSLFPYPMTFNLVHMPATDIVKEKNGYSSFTMTNVPAFKPEPNMPPEAEVTPWILLFYASPQTGSTAKYWADYGKAVFEYSKEDLKVNDDIRRATTTAIGTAATPEDKIAKLFAFVRAKVTNPYDDAAGTSAADIEKVKENKSPADTLKRGVGTGWDIDMLFGAMAAAAGFDVRVARVADGSDAFFAPNLANSYFLSTYDIAVKVGTQWKLFNPGSRYTQLDMLSWWEEGVPALIPDPKEPIWIQTKISPPHKSLSRRAAQLRLQPDGTLEGDVSIEYSGHIEATERENLDGLTAAEREEDIVSEIKKRMSTAEVSAVRLENMDDTSKRLTLRYHIRVPQYAQRTGRRLFLQPSFFQQGIAQEFSSTERKYDIYFPYPWSEDDTVTIDLPKGFQLENPEVPGGVQVADLTSLNIAISTATDGSAIQFTRKFMYGGNGTVLLPVAAYPNIKKAFDLFHQNDAASLTLRDNNAAQQ